MILKHKTMQLMADSKGKSLLVDIAFGAIKPNMQMNLARLDMSSGTILP